MKRAKKCGVKYYIAYKMDVFATTKNQKTVVKYAHSLGLKVAMYKLDTSQDSSTSDYKKLVKYGVDVDFSDYYPQ